MEARNLADRYDLPILDWRVVIDHVAAGFSQAPGTGGPDRHTCWLATLDPDGRPHVTGIGAIWHAGAWWFQTGRATRKGRNLARDPRCSLSVALRDLDLVVDGEARLVVDRDVVAQLAARWAEDWPCTVDGSGIALTAAFSAPSAGPPPWHVYRIDVRAATALHVVEPGGATRWTFGRADVSAGARRPASGGRGRS